MATGAIPAPRLGEQWSLPEFIDKGVEFTTLMGTFVPDLGQQPPIPPPALGGLSLHFWYLHDQADDQTPHKEDEAYYVLKGKGTLTIEGKPHQLKTGDLIFVPRCADHRFSAYQDEGLYLLVIFGPNFTG